MGLDAYEAAGGRVKRDLFSEGNEGIQILDTALLVELTNRKLQSLADVLGEEGWKWVEIQPELNYQFLGRFRRLTGEPASLTEKKEAKLNKLIARREALASKLSDEDEEANEKLYERIEEISEKINAIECDRPLQFSAETKAQAGAMVSISDEGEPEYVYGLLSKEDERRIAKEATSRR